MMEHTYWRRQLPEKPLYPDLEWSKPVRRDQVGRLLVVGGNKLGFSAVAESYEYARSTGAGEVKVLLPDCLKKSVPSTLTDVIFAACTTSGGLSKDALPELKAAAEWAQGVVLVGDAGRNAETALAYEEFIKGYAGPLTLTRDAVDLVRNDPRIVAERPDTLLVLSFAQVQKLLSGVYYPKVLTFAMQLMQFVEAMHKFTITYPCTIVTLHKDSLVIADGGDVITQPWSDPMAIWKGSVATKAACYWLWHRDSVLGSTTASVA
jgi:NAD(P)H-hydrate repair Nnr-like enzyme with NAD(P)H-hydrate dehydratase domain